MGAREMKPVYHYTKGVHWPRIVSEGVLRLTDIQLDPGEPPSLWATTDPLFVGCIAAMYASSRGTALDLVAHEGGAYRIQIADSVPSLDWRTFAGRHLTAKTERSLRMSAQRCGDNVRDWRAYLKPVPSSAWVGAQRYDLDSRTWRPCFAGKAAE